MSESQNNFRKKQKNDEFYYKNNLANEVFSEMFYRLKSMKQSRSLIHLRYHFSMAMLIYNLMVDKFKTCFTPGQLSFLDGLYKQCEQEMDNMTGTPVDDEDFIETDEVSVESVLEAHKCAKNKVGYV